ncbi:MAG: MFS transporter [Actinomycetota bacterium]
MGTDEQPDLPSEIPPSIATPGMLGRVKNLLIDLEPLRASREFRLLWMGESISEIGSHITTVAIPFQVFSLTRSSFAVGMLGLCALVPLLTLSLLGGAIADAVERRALILRCDSALALTSIILAINALPGQRHLWVLYAMATAQAAVYSIQAPAIRSLVPRLISKELFPSANALDSISGSTAHLLGPTVGGVLIATIGLTGAYVVDIATFAAAFIAVGMMQRHPPVEGSTPASLESIREGFRFLKGRKVLQSTFTVDLNAMIFGMPMSLFPAMAIRLGGGPTLTGILYAAPFAGSFIVSMLSGRMRHVRRQGRATMIAVLFWGAFIAGFGLAGTTWLALLMLALAGAADMISGVYRSTILQTVAPDEMRGRLSGIELAVVASGPSLGDVEAGVVASLVSLPFAIVSGGIACIAGVGVLAARVPQLGRYDAREPTP